MYILKNRVNFKQRRLPMKPYAELHDSELLMRNIDPEEFNKLILLKQIFNHNLCTF